MDFHVSAVARGGSIGCLEISLSDPTGTGIQTMVDTLSAPPVGGPVFANNVSVLPPVSLIPNDLLERITQGAPSFDRAAAVPDGIISELSELGIPKLAVPPEYGGGEVHPRQVFETIATLARADASVAWLMMVTASGGIVAAFTPEAGARQAFESPTAFVAGVLAPMGQAKRVDGGYRISGRWPYGSGIHHATHMAVGVLIDAEGEKRLSHAIVPTDKCVVHPTWEVSGLRATGSHDFSVEDVFVEDAAIGTISNAAPRFDRPLFRFPPYGMLALGVASVAVGIGQAAIDELVALARAKTPTGSSRRLAERPLTQATVAKDVTRLAAAAGMLFDRIDHAFDSAKEGQDMSVTTRAGLRTAATYATEVAASTTANMYRLGGGTSNYETSPLQRCLRDVNAATQHLMVGEMIYELAGRTMLGIETDTSVL